MTDERWIGDPIGYSDVWSVAPEQSIRFMVSTSSETYRASLLRLSGTDRDSYIPVSSPIDALYRGRTQVTRPGSCVIVEEAKAVESLTSVSVSAWVWPTRLGAPGEQALVSAGSWSLFVNQDGFLSFQIGTTVGTTVAGMKRPLTERAWSLVFGSYDASLQRVTLHCHELGLFAPEADTVTAPVAGALRRGGPAVWIAARPSADLARGTYGEAHFDGKLESPTIYDRALHEAELAQVATSRGDDQLTSDGLVAAWRFQHAMSGDHVVDIGPSAMHGRAVNAPTRAMTGHRWRGQTSDPRISPDDYGAIHFHCDDLDDAGWDCDFTLTVPSELASGVYAIQLTTQEGREDLVPFIVRPADEPTADVALVLPTMTYLAYANERLPGADSYSSYRTTADIPVSEWDVWLEEHPEFGMSLYDSHADDSGCCYSSRLRPIPSIRPDYMSSQLGFPRHLAADLILIEWLVRLGAAFDVLTDEDLDAGGAAVIERYRVVLTGSHPEYVTERMFDAFETYVSQGGRLIYLGGNGLCWVTSLSQPRRHLIEVRRGQTNQLPWDSRPGECHHSTTGELGGLWEVRGRSARSLLGVGFAAMGLRAQPYVRCVASHDPRYAWVFDGLSDADVIGGQGQVLGDAGGYEIDRYDVSLGSPPGTVLLARAEGDKAEYELFTPGSTHVDKPPVGEPPYACADMTLLETSTGGAVFAVGSVAWTGSLPVSQSVSTVTWNVLDAFRSDRMWTI